MHSFPKSTRCRMRAANEIRHVPKPVLLVCFNQETGLATLAQIRHCKMQQLLKASSADPLAPDSEGVAFWITRLLPAFVNGSRRSCLVANQTTKVHDSASGWIRHETRTVLC